MAAMAKPLRLALAAVGVVLLVWMVHRRTSQRPATSADLTPSVAMLRHHRWRGLKKACFWGMLLAGVIAVSWYGA
jgi:hypothetical protein